MLTVTGGVIQDIVRKEGEKETTHRFHNKFLIFLFLLLVNSLPLHVRHYYNFDCRFVPEPTEQASILISLCSPLTQNKTE